MNIKAVVVTPDNDPAGNVMDLSWAQALKASATVVKSTSRDPAGKLTVCKDEHPENA